MTSRNALPLSTLFFIRDKSANAEAESAVAMQCTTCSSTATAPVAKSADPVQAKLKSLKLNGEVPSKRPAQHTSMSTDMVTKEKTNVVWRQFMISRAAMLANQR
ncbi:unnamed protein product [Phytophthora fragariaefolia]|uniref:Unnamed protein product n=1 Tax=Phytophthora fragariaefolia TaxID=1490495 RepID=A0A9W6XWE4_9STRA|nr:unnamed protein product [Phytophthora fragariaefolia]